MNNSIDDLLIFKEFPPIHGQKRAQININSPTKITFDSRDPLDDLVDQMTKNVKSADDLTSISIIQSPVEENNIKNVDQYKTSPLKIEFYQQYFNVDTITVFERIVNAVLPKRAPPDYLNSFISKNPDLYGPFWVSVTLIFSIAISGNIADYWQSANLNYKWKYNFHLVSYAATAIYVYALVVPIVLWTIFKWCAKSIGTSSVNEATNSCRPTLLSLMCLYGYSLVIYIPISILWVIQYSPIQWALVISGALISGSVLILILTPALKTSKYSVFIMFGILLLHFSLASGFMIYFFHLSNINLIVDKI